MGQVLKGEMGTRSEGHRGRSCLDCSRGGSSTVGRRTAWGRLDQRIPPCGFVFNVGQDRQQLSRGAGRLKRVWKMEKVANCCSSI